MPSLFETSIFGPVAVIGDVHGQVDQLQRILNQLRDLPDFQERWIVFIGDMVDRGPDSKGALDMLADLREEHPRTTLVSGNHELAMGAALGFIDAPEYTKWGERWLDHYGSEATFDSYGVSDFGNLDALRSVVPARHAEMLADVPWCVEHPDFFFVHAGVSQNSPFRLQREILRQRDYSLNRPQWLCSKSLAYDEPPADCRYVVVSGHVHVPEVQFGQQRILIDTTGGSGGSLSCLMLPEKEILHSHPPQAKPTPAASEQPIKRKRGWF